MSACDDFLNAARADAPVYIGRVRERFNGIGTRPVCLDLRLYDGSLRRFALALPEAEGPQEARFVEEYLNATVYNALSVLGGRAMTVYVDPSDAALAAWAAGLNDAFQVDAPMAARRGYGRCMNVNQRTLAALSAAQARFRFEVEPASRLPAAPPVGLRRRREGGLKEIPARSARGMWLGMDVGGTDVKLAASVNGQLCGLKEYDWNPAALRTARALIEPLALLTRLTRAAANLCAAGLAEAVPTAAFERTASRETMRDAIEAMEARLPGTPRPFDGIGLCFPDVVIRNLIIGGETPKTQGMRDGAADYEAEFGQITRLAEVLGADAANGSVSIINDGPMAAFATAVEQAASGRPLSEGFFAHTLGTDLGTGWVLADGSVPELPMEMYNCLIDLGSQDQRTFDSADVRSVRSTNTGLPGATQKYACQAGVFRLAAKLLPEADPELWQALLAEGLFVQKGDGLFVPVAPEDRRKPCLERLMAQAEDPASPCAEIFRQVGESLGAVWLESRFLLDPECGTRTLYGRLVKTPACFEALREGARRVAPEIRLEAADEALAVTPLMRQLAAHPRYTVAQFGQAVGAIHYACAFAPKS